MRVRAREDHDVLAPGSPGGKLALWTGQEYELTEAQVAESGDRVEALAAPSAPAPAPEPPDDATTASTDIASMTVADLRAYAAEHEIDLGGARAKADIVAAIEASQ